MRGLGTQSSRCYRGSRSSAGEWGHTTIVLDGRLCRCGKHGCVEAYVGASGIMLNLRELSPDSTLLHPEDQTATIAALEKRHKDIVALMEAPETYAGGDVVKLNRELIENTERQEELNEQWADATADVAALNA